MYKRSREEYERACQYLPGGVNSPARAFSSVRQQPLFIDRAEDSRIYDIDGIEYIDFVSSWGPMLFGHCQQDVIAAVADQLKRGTSFGAPTIVETEMAAEIVELISSVDRVRMVNSGTEATMSALRLARGYTGRDKVIKFTGNYHGHGDSFLIKAGSGPATLGLPDSPGVPEELARLTISVPYNNKDYVEKVFQEQGEEIAAVILEPVAANMGVVPPRDNFLEFLREITEEYGTILIFDEVITGFRLAPGGAQQYYGVEADLTCLGKIIGAGLPVGAYGGKEEIMDEVAPVGPVYQAGTLSGNPLAMAAGYQMMKLIQQEGVYEQLEEKSSYLASGIKKEISKLEIPCSINRVGSLISLFFTGTEVVDYQTASSSDTELYADYFQGMLKRGIYLAPSQFEAMFVSLKHSQEDLDTTIRAAGEVLQEISKG